MDARSLAGVVFSLFPVQTLGELGLGRSEVISRSNCKVECTRRVGGSGALRFPCPLSVTCTSWLLCDRPQAQFIRQL